MRAFYTLTVDWNKAKTFKTTVCYEHLPVKNYNRAMGY